MKFRMLLAFQAAFFLASCDTPIPLAESYPASHQLKMQAAQHWQDLAGEIADEVVQAVATRDNLRGRPLFVFQPPVNSPFSAAFAELLRTELVHRGVLVTDGAPSGLILEYTSQVLVHRGAREGAHGFVHFLSADLNPLDRRVDEEPSEVIITTSLRDGTYFLGRHSEAFYIQPADRWHYAALPGKTFPVVGEPDLATERAERIYQRSLRK